MTESAIIRYEFMYPVTAVLATFALIIIARMEKIIKALDVKGSIKKVGLVVLLLTYLLVIQTYLQLIFWVLFPQLLEIVLDFLIFVPMFLVALMGHLHPIKRIKNKGNERIILMQTYWIISSIISIAIMLIFVSQKYGYLQWFISIFVISLLIILSLYRSTIKKYLAIKKSVN